MGLIVGARDDPHVSAVLSATHREMVVVDAESFTRRPLTLTRDGLAVGDTMISVDRGWIRRLAREDWGAAVEVGTLAAARQAATLSALAAIVRDERISWLTPVEQLGGAENKLHQYRRVADASIPVPEWLVTTDPEMVPDRGRWVSKPLGPGWFIDGGRGWIVPTTAFDPANRSAVVGAPFLLQRQIAATAHARVVTVGTQVFSATLPARDLPMDWRLSSAAHRAFAAAPAPSHVHVMATDAARALRVGYSAQDWILDQEGVWWFVDLNPAGQWLFLPPEVAVPITAAIAHFLDGGS